MGWLIVAGFAISAAIASARFASSWRSAVLRPDAGDYYGGGSYLSPRLTTLISSANSADKGTSSSPIRHPSREPGACLAGRTCSHSRSVKPMRAARPRLIAEKGLARQRSLRHAGFDAAHGGLQGIPAALAAHAPRRRRRAAGQRRSHGARRPRPRSAPPRRQVARRPLPMRRFWHRPAASARRASTRQTPSLQPADACLAVGHAARRPQCRGRALAQCCLRARGTAEHLVGRDGPDRCSTDQCSPPALIWNARYVSSSPQGDDKIIFSRRPSRSAKRHGGVTRGLKSFGRRGDLSPRRRRLRRTVQVFLKVFRAKIG